MDNSWGSAKKQFTVAESQLFTAMESLHDGRTGDARMQVRTAATALEEATTAAKGEKPGLPPKLVWGGYQSSGRLNAHSVGVLERGGTTIRVPADSLVYGLRRSLAYVWVVAPTATTGAAGVSAALR